MSGPIALAAVDLGASSGRVVLGRVGPDTLELTEVSRFRNGPVPLPDGLYWDAPGLYLDILDGIRVAERRSGGLAGTALGFGSSCSRFVVAGPAPVSASRAASAIT